MDSTRRYIFNGSAAAYGGRFVRPEDVVLTSNGGSALAQVGGRSVWSDTNIRIGKAFRMSSCFTSAEGLYDNRSHEIEVTYGKRKLEELTATTRVRAEIRDLVVGGAPPTKPSDPPEPAFSVGRVTAALTSQSQPPGGGRQTKIALEEAAVDGVSIDGFVLLVDLVTDPFREHDTHAKVVKALSDPGFVKEHGVHFGRTRPLAAKTAGRAPKRAASGVPAGSSGGILRVTLARELRWKDGRAFPGSKIDGNTVTIPNLGKVHFAEMLIKQDSRRLGMLRFQLGSPTGGSAECVDVDTNGNWSI